MDGLQPHRIGDQACSSPTDTAVPTHDSSSAAVVLTSSPVTPSHATLLYSPEIPTCLDVNVTDGPEDIEGTSPPHEGPASDVGTPRSSEQDEEEGSQRHDVTLFGHRVHLTLVRSYNPPVDVIWKDHSFGTRLFGFVYDDQTVSDQFFVFSKRSFVALFVGILYCGGLVLSGTLPLMTRRFMGLWLACAAVLLVCMTVDGWVHFFAKLTPAAAKIRMGVSLVACLVFVTAASWSIWAAQAHCDEAYVFPHYPGRKTFANKADLLRHCRVFVEPMPIVAAACSIGLSLHPLAHGPLMVIFAFLNVFVGRWYADVHEPTTERLVKAASIVLISGGAAALTTLQFFATRASFEAKIRIEGQRQETERRAAELQHLLTTIVPAAVLPRLLAGGDDQFSIDDVECASMLFADMKGFTAWSSSRSAVQVTSMLNFVVAAIDALAASAVGVEKIKTIGDAYWAVAGIPVPNESHADQLVLFAWHMNAAVASLNRHHPEWDNVSWRVAVHTGPMAGALFGERQVSYEVFGETARIAQLVEANGVPGALCVTQAVLDALFHSPPDVHPRHHRSIEHELPHDQVLDIFEFPPPRADSVGQPSPAALSLQYGQRTCSSQRSHSVVSLQSALSVISGDSLHGATSIPSVANSPRSAMLSHRGNRYLATPQSQRLALPRLPSLKAASDSEGSRGTGRKEQLNEAAAMEMATPKWRFLPWFKNDELEATFKERCEIVVRPNARAAAVFSGMAHALSVGAGFGEADPCYTTPSLVLQIVAAVGFVAALSITLHPRGPLSLAGLVTAISTEFSVIGLGIAVFGGCLFAHDVLWLCIFITVPHSFAVGPISWPVFTVGVWLAAMAPGLPLSLLYSPAGPSNALLSGVGAGVLSVCLAYVEETSLRRRFIEEELSKRGEQQLQLLSEERVVVLERLVPKHVIDDLIVWFGTGMDPQRSIARSYEHVVVAFLQLRPGAVSDLAVLHAEIDRDLDTVNEEVACSTSADSSQRILEKIKTVGDVLMLAGPFAHQHRSQESSFGTPDSNGTTHEDVAATFFAVIALAQAVQPRCPLRLGAHVGPVVGTVQGSSRLAFDTFGDAVNIASRVMSSAASKPPHAPTADMDEARPKAAGAAVTGAFRVSADLHEAICCCPSAAPGQFGDPVTVAAKGKGDLVVFPVLDVAVAASMEDVDLAP